MSKLSFRARALDASKPMPIYMAEELPDLPDYSAINRAVPQMPSGMEKEEECEHHLQRAICAGLIIPTPEVADIPNREFYDKVYPATYKQPRQLIHMQPFSMEQEFPDYDMDSEDEKWLQSQSDKLDLTPLKFEEMMDTLEKSSGQNVVTEEDAKSLLKEDDDLTIAVFDYWLNKRLKLTHPLILTVKTEQRPGTAANNPYLAFRRRTEKMQTRKNRKNDETSYEKMLKLRRDLHRAVTLLELIKKREKMKRENVHLTVEIFEKRFHAKDFSGAIYAEASAIKTTRPAFTPIFHNHYTNQGWSNKAILKDEVIPRKEKRQYKKRKHKSLSHARTAGMGGGSSGLDSYGAFSSDEEPSLVSQFSPEPEEAEDDGQFAFRRNKLCSYHMPLPEIGNWPWYSKEENGLGDKRFRFTLTSLSHPRKCIGFARRRVGRGGRIILDRMATNNDDFWRKLDFTILEPKGPDGEVKALENATTACLVGANINNTSSIDFIDTNNSSGLRTDIKSEFSNNFDEIIGSSNGGSGVTRTCNVNNFSENDPLVRIKQEVVEEEVSEGVDGGAGPSQSADSEVPINTYQEVEEMLSSIRRDWLHFRPKTPPPEYEQPCHLLPASECYIVPSANPSSFSVELQSLDPPSALLDTSTFLTDPFTFEAMDFLDVPVTDTRQPFSSTPGSGSGSGCGDKTVQTGINLNVNVGLNTLTPNSVNDSCTEVCSSSRSDEMVTSSNYESCSTNELPNSIGRTLFTPGCSQFYVSDLGENNVPAGSRKLGSESSSNSIFSSTLTSPKFNSVNAVSGGRPRANTSSTSLATATTHNTMNTTNDGSLTNTNGLWSQLGFDGRTKNNKLSYAYPGGVGYSNASTGTLSLRTSAHTVTLNRNSHSHSANILQIPIEDDSEPVSNKLVNSQCTDTGTTATNNKTKTICRKNNLVMEVT